MLYEIVNSFPNDIFLKERGLLISLYQPTHRNSPDKKQDVIVFKNLLRDVENSLKHKLENKHVESTMKPFYELSEDKNFWNNTLDGIAILASQDKCIIYNLHNPVKALVIVAKSFHIKPLLKEFQSIDNYLFLELSRENFNLYRGNQYGIEEVKIPDDTLRTMEEVLGNQLSEPTLSYGSFGGAGGSARYYGQGEAKQEIDKDTEKYFRYVDSFIYKNYSKELKIPLILISVVDNHSKFKNISNNPFLLEEGINKSIDSLTLEEIHKNAKLIIDSINSEKIRKLVETYTKAAAGSLGSSDLAQVAKAAIESRIEVVLIEEDKIIPGKINHNTGVIRSCNIGSPNCDDVLDDLAELVILNGGKVLVFPKDAMPSSTGIAAIYRYKQTQK